jgi:hypothetical protein
MSEPQPQNVISIVVVSYNSAEELKTCIGAALSAGIKGAEIIVVDNASEDADSLPRGDWPANVKLIRNSRNEGYARAVNRGFAETRGRFVLLLNPDVVVDGAGLSLMMDALDSDTAAWAAAARLDWPDGRFQRYYTAEPTAAALAARLTILEPLFRNSAVVRNYLKSDMDPDAPQEIETAPGACLMIKKSALEAVGGMDERFPLFFNDVDFSRRLRGAGGKIVYVPGARFAHQMQASVGRMEPALRRAELMLSAVRYVGKYGGRPRAFALKLLFVIDSKLRAAAAALRVLAGRKKRGAFGSAVRAAVMVAFDRSLFD